MCRIASLSLVALLALNSVSRSDEDDDSIEGTYLIIGMEIGGEKLPDELVTAGKEETRTIKVTKDKFIAKKDGKDDPASYKIDTCKKPHEIDLTAKKDDGKEEKMYGIFKVDGDKLIICMVESNKAADRPKEFKTTKDNKAMIITLQKKKK